MIKILWKIYSPAFQRSWWRLTITLSKFEECLWSPEKTNMFGNLEGFFYIKKVLTILLSSFLDHNTKRWWLRGSYDEMQLQMMTLHKHVISLSDDFSQRVEKVWSIKRILLDMLKLRGSYVLQLKVEWVRHVYIEALNLFFSLCVKRILTGNKVFDIINRQIMKYRGTKLQ